MGGSNRSNALALAPALSEERPDGQGGAAATIEVAVPSGGALQLLDLPTDQAKEVESDAQRHGYQPETGG